MSDYKSIGESGTFKSPQPWIFKPVDAYRFKLMLRVFIGVIVFYFFIILITNSRIKESIERRIAWITVAFIIYLIIASIGIRIYFKSIEYQVHGTEIVIKKGLVNITENHIPFSNITNIAIKRGPIDQILGIGSIIIYTGGVTLNFTRIASIAGTRIYSDVGHFVLNQIKDYETFFTYLLGENMHSKNKLDKKFWINFLSTTKEIKNLLEK